MRYAPEILFPAIWQYGDLHEVTVGEGEAAIVSSEREVLGLAPGVHVNLPEAMMLEALEAWRITPSHPQHEILGCATARLLFSDQAACDAALVAAGLAEED